MKFVYLMIYLDDILCYVFFIKSRLIKIVYKKIINIDWLMLDSLQETKYGPLLLLPPLLQQLPQMKFKQQQPQQQQKIAQF